MLSRLVILLVITAFAFASVSKAQKGTAPNGYYPNDFQGDTFTGKATSARPDLEELSLTYTNGKKTEQWVGRLVPDCNWKDKSGQWHPIRVSDIFEGDIMTVFYMPKTAKVNGVKKTENWIIGIGYIEMNGKKVPDEKRSVLFCGGRTTMLTFKAFN